MGKSHSEQSAIQPGMDTHRGSPEDHTLGEITKGCVIPRSGWVLSLGSSFHGVPRAANPQ